MWEVYKVEVGEVKKSKFIGYTTFTVQPPTEWYPKGVVGYQYVGSCGRINELVAGSLTVLFRSWLKTLVWIKMLRLWVSQTSML